MSVKKETQLGTHRAIAERRLQRNLLFSLVVSAGHKCFRCGRELTRETFSLDHKIDWLDSPDPVGLFFDLDNIAFSHLSCNKAAGRNGKRLTQQGTVDRSELMRAYKRGYYHSHVKQRMTDPVVRAKRNAYMKAYQRKRAGEKRHLQEKRQGSLI
jgi:hypothetical protein